MNNNEYKPDEEELSIANEVVDARIHYPKDMRPSKGRINDILRKAQDTEVK